MVGFVCVRVYFFVVIAFVVYSLLLCSRFLNADDDVVVVVVAVLVVAKCRFMVGIVLPSLFHYRTIDINL